MGIIKTAMMSGAAMYGVKQISKEAERRHSQRPIPQPQYQSEGPGPRSRQQPNQSYQYQDEEYDQLSPPPYRQMIANQPAYYEQANFQGRGYGQQHPPQQYMYGEHCDQSRGPTFQPPPSPSRQRVRAPRYGGQVPPEGYGIQQQQRQQQQQRSGFVEPYEDDEPQQSSSSHGGSRNGLLSQAMQLAQTQGGRVMGGGKGREGSAQEFLSGFLEK